MDRKARKTLPRAPFTKHLQGSNNNNKNPNINWASYQVPVSVSKHVYVHEVTHFILTTAFGDHYHYCPHFTDRDIETHRAQLFAQDPQVSTRSQNLNRGACFHTHSLSEHPIYSDLCPLCQTWYWAQGYKHECLNIHYFPTYSKNDLRRHGDEQKEAHRI